MLFDFLPPPDAVSGLRPRAWVCLGPGFAREEIKSSYLERGAHLAGQVFFSLEEWALHLASLLPGFSVSPAAGTEGGSQKISLLGPFARQKILQRLLKEPRIIEHLPQIRERSRQRGFLKKLDRSVQSLALSAADAIELEVFESRLQEKIGERALRVELQTLLRVYQTWIRANGLHDVSTLLEEVTRQLRETPRGFFDRKKLPQEVHVLLWSKLESRFEVFIEECERHFPHSEDSGTLRFIRNDLLVEKSDALSQTIPSLQWQRWHTLDDAVEAVASRITADREARGWSAFSDHVILMPDDPSVRRSLGRALSHAGIPLADPRDPAQLLWDEAMKQALLPLEAAAKRFARTSLVRLLMTSVAGSAVASREERNQAIRFLNEKTRTAALAQIPRIGEWVGEFERRWGGRKSVLEVRELHLEWLRTEKMDRWVDFFEGIWLELESDLKRVESEPVPSKPDDSRGRKVSLLFWWEEIRDRLAEMSPPPEPLKPQAGVRLYRLSQVPWTGLSVGQSIPRLTILTPPPTWLSGETPSDYAWSAREREILGSEFGFRTGISMREERIATLHHWIQASQQVELIDAEYEWDGRERVSLEPFLMTLWGDSAQEMAPQTKGSHPRWVKSFQASRPVRPEQVRLRAFESGEPFRCTATELDAYSRCAFLGLGSKRWKLEDLREPSLELWPEVQGTLLHEAARILIECRTDQGFALTIPEVIDRAWAKVPKKGWQPSPVLERSIRFKLARILEKFAEKEREYFERSQTQVMSLEGPELTLETPEGIIRGIPDRVDMHPAGLFLMDYKTSSDLPKGKDMVELGYRLQLPFYALAARQKFDRPILGVQFVELNKSGARAKGVFFSAYNGKEPGKLTKLQARNQSLFSNPPEDIWERLEASISNAQKGMKAGVFDTIPKHPPDCDRCRLRDACGRTRRLLAEGEV